MNWRNAQKFELHFHQKYYVFLSSLHNTADVSENCTLRCIWSLQHPTKNILNSGNVVKCLQLLEFKK